jgi:subtilase family serine protease
MIAVPKHLAPGTVAPRRGRREDKPDLVIQTLNVSPDPSALGTGLALTVTVRNTGPGAVGTFRVAAWQHRPAARVYGTTGDFNWTVSGLADGATTTRTASFTPTYTGARRAWVYLDADRQVADGDEANNVAYDDYEIVAR